MKTEAVETNIFKSNSQLLSLDPAGIQPLFDRILVRDVKDPDRIGSIWIPDTAAERGVGKNGLLRLGIVVAAGKGDPWAKEKLINGGTEVVRKALGACQYVGPKWHLHGKEQNGYPCDGGRVFDMVDYQYNECPACRGGGIRRWPMYCRVGDTVLYDVRKEAQFFLDNVPHYLIYEQQSVFAIYAASEGRESAGQQTE